MTRGRENKKEKERKGKGRGRRRREEERKIFFFFIAAAAPLTNFHVQCTIFKILAPAAGGQREPPSLRSD